MAPKHCSICLPKTRSEIRRPARNLWVIWTVRVRAASISGIGWCTRCSRRSVSFECFGCGLTMSDARDNRLFDADAQECPRQRRSWLCAGHE